MLCSRFRCICYVFWKPQPTNMYGLSRPFAVDLCRFTNTGLAFEQKMDGYVMRDVAVEMSPDGLGLQLDVSNGGLVVCGHTLMPEGIRNPGEVSHPT